MTTRPRLLFRLLALWQPPAPAARELRKSSVQTDTPAEPPGACGWFDSSHELVRGLHVQELSATESLAAALPLAAWLQLQLDTCCSARPA